MCIHTGDNTLILRETMKDLEKRLDPRRFQRVHRSTIVNLDLVRQVKPHTNGECFLVLDSGAQVKVRAATATSSRGSCTRSAPFFFFFFFFLAPPALVWRLRANGI